MSMQLKWQPAKVAVQQAVQAVQVSISFSGSDHWDTGDGSTERSFSGTLTDQ